MKELLSQLLAQTILELDCATKLPENWDHKQIKVSRSRDNNHGDYSTTIALSLAKRLNVAPMSLAQQIIDDFPSQEKITKIEIVKPGFINFFVEDSAFLSVIKNVITQANDYGRVDLGAGKRVTVEFVSANPTGPLHIGHGRGAAFGDSLSRVLTFAGYNVHKEYYFNDAGRQMDILSLSVWLRYLQLSGLNVDFPDNAYRGDYIRDIAKALLKIKAVDYYDENIALKLPTRNMDAEIHLDQLIEFMQDTLGAQKANKLHQFVLDTQIEEISDDLSAFHVEFDQWFSERSLVDSGAIEKALNKLRDNNYLYEKDGATWFKSSQFGDSKDRVVIRNNSRHTYFAADIAYMSNKIERGFKQLIYIFGADHHGTIERMKAAFTALGYDLNQFTILLVQMASLIENGEKISMSTRRAQYVTLQQLRDDVGVDAARFFYNMRKIQQQLDFDIDLAKSKNNENPVFYVQYAHARISSIIRQAKASKNIIINLSEIKSADLNDLNLEIEKSLANKLQSFTDVIISAANDYTPHLITYYLRELASLFHSYYNQVQILNCDDKIRLQRLILCLAIRQVIANGLKLIGVSAPEKM